MWDAVVAEAMGSVLHQAILTHIRNPLDEMGAKYMNDGWLVVYAITRNKAVESWKDDDLEGC